MHIKSIEIENWRSIKNVKIDAEKIMMFIGQNNHGKSNLLSAILFFFGEIKHQEEDFNKVDKVDELYVELEFTGLDEDEKATFKKYVTSHGNITVRKTAYNDGNFRYNGYIEIENSEIGKQDTQPAELKLRLEDGNFLGLKSVAKGILGEVYFIPAVKEATDDFTSKNSSAFGKIFSEIISEIPKENAQFKEMNDKLLSMFSDLNKGDSEDNSSNFRLTEIANLEIKLNDALREWDVEIEIKLVSPNIDDIIKSSSQVLVNDGVQTGIGRKGHGLQRRLILAMIEVMAERLNNQQNKKTEIKSNRQASKSRYLIFEEPELYLHPQAQRLLFKSLISLSDKDFQVILSTHSSAFIDLERYESIYIVTKKAETGTTVKTCNESIFAGDQKQKKKEFNLAYYINPDRGELFFAKKVILVEGQTEKVALPVLAEKLGTFKHEYTIIDCASKNNIHLYIKLLNKFEIPYVAVFDSDGEKEDFKQITSIIKEGLGEIVIFENDIEYEIGMKEEDKKESKPLSALNFIENKGGVIPKQLEQKIRDIYI